MQESGRAGRDGGVAYCELLACGDDRLVLENFIHANRPERRVIENVLQTIFSQGSLAVVSRYDLQTGHDLPEAVVDLLLTRLEIAGFLKLKGRSWKRGRIRALVKDGEILAAYTGRKHKAITALLGQKGNLDLLEMSGQLGMKIEALNELLEDLEAGGDIGLSRTHRLHIYRVVKPVEAILALAEDLHATFMLHTDRDLQRIDAVFRIATTRKCITRSLLAHFGEKLEQPCGTCSTCLGEKRPQKLPCSETEAVTLAEIEKIQQLVASRHAVLSSPQRLARFLCGISSPAMMRWRMYFKDEWGLLRRLPYEEVLVIVKAQVM